MRHAPAAAQGQAGLAVLVRAHPSGAPLDGEAARVLRVDATAVALGPPVAAKGPANVETPTVAVAAGGLPTRRVRAVLRVATDRVPVRPIVPSPVPSVGPAPLLEVGNGVLRVAAPQAVDVGRVGTTSKEGVVVARRPTDAGTGVVTANGGASRHATANGVAPLLAAIPIPAAALEEARDPCDGAPREARLVPGVLRVRVPTLHAETVEGGPVLASPSSGHLDEADGSETLLGPATAVQEASGQTKEANDEARAGAAAVVVARPASPLVATRALVRGVTSEGGVAPDAGLEESAGNDPLDQTATEEVAASGRPLVLEEGGRGLGRIGTGPGPRLVVVEDPRARRTPDVP